MKKLITLTFCLAFLGILSAQEYSISDVKRNYWSSGGTFYENDEVAGYTFFTFKEKSDKKYWYYNLTVLSPELEKIVSKPIRVVKQTTLVSASSTNDGILLKMFDRKEKRVMYKVVNFAGETVATEYREAGKFERRVLGASTSDGLMGTTATYNRGSVGFLDFVNLDKSAYEVIGLDREANEVWKYAVPESKGVRTSSVIATNDDYTVLIESSAKNRTTRDIQFKMIVLDDNGKEAYTYELEEEDKALIPFSVNFNEGSDGLFLTGEYFDADKKSAKAESKGIFFMTLSNSGKVMEESYVSWEKDVKPLYNSDKGLVRRSLYFHDIVTMDDGRIIAIAEEYKKQVSVMGTAAKLLAASSSNVSTDAGNFEILIGDIIVFTLDSKFELKQIDVFEKNPNRISIEGMGLTNKHLLANYLEATGAFDYRFMQTNKEKDYAAFVYTDREKVEGKTFKKIVVNTAKFETGGPEPKKAKFVLDLKWNDPQYTLYPSNEDATVLLTYDRKSKKLNISKHSKAAGE